MDRRIELLMSKTAIIPPPQQTNPAIAAAAIPVGPLLEKPIPAATMKVANIAAVRIAQTSDRLSGDFEGGEGDFPIEDE